MDQSNLDRPLSDGRLWNLVGRWRAGASDSAMIVARDFALQAAMLNAV
jgi:hypothetical protein